jgi:hypothetical protein
MKKINELKENIKKTEEFLYSLKKELWAEQETQLKILGYTIGKQIDYIDWNDKIIRYEIVKFIKGSARIYPLKKNGKPSQINERLISLSDDVTKYYKLV